MPAAAGDEYDEVAQEQKSGSRSDEGDGVSRRRFLRRLGVVAAGALAAACGRDATPTPSPLATPTATSITRSPLAPPSTLGGDGTVYMPLMRQDQGVAAAAAPTPEPLPTVTPTPRPPTPTPTPPATPFPPGPPSKLGLHVERNLPQIFEVLESQGVSAVTTLELDANFVAEIKAISPATRVIGRVIMPQANLQDLDPIGAAHAFVEQLLPYADDDRRRPYFDAWISFNEPVASSTEEMSRLAEFEAERTRLLGDRGIRSIIGNFGTGQPPLEFWPAFLPAVQVAQQYNGWLGLHEYSAPTIYYLSTRENQGRYPGVAAGDKGWLTLRYRQVYNQYLIPAGLSIPLVMTELGVDGLVADRPGPPDARGWQDFQRFWAENGYGLWGPGAYVEQLVWYDEAMRQNDYVIGGCIYALGTSAQWLSYDIAGPAASVLTQYLSVHAEA